MEMVNEATIGASIGGIDSIRLRIAQECAKIEKEQTTLEEIIRNLNGMWAGQAHDVFQTDFLQNLNQLRKITAQIREMTVYEGTAVSEYTKAEMDVNAAIGVL